MHYYSRLEHLRHAYFAVKKWQKRVRRSKSKVSQRKIGRTALPITIYPPAEFNLGANYDATVRCLDELRTVTLSQATIARRRSVLLDFTSIRSISLAGALVLASEMDRWKRVVGRSLRPAKLSEWNPQVKEMLNDLGFFSMLGITVDIKESEEYRENVTVLPMISSESLDRALLVKMLQLLKDVALVLRQDPAVYPALVEAAYNATMHAYPSDYEYRHPPAIKGWWATACWLPDQKCVKFAVFDQGVGIAETLPRWQGWERIRGWMADSFGALGATALNDSSKMIEAAIKVDRTSLDGGHGKGLQDVIAVVHTVPGAQVRILSGTGSILYKKDKATIRRDEAQHLGGTLIEWTIPVGAPQEKVES